METELKIRAYAALFHGESAARSPSRTPGVDHGQEAQGVLQGETARFIRRVQQFEVNLARQTEACHNGKQPWPDVGEDLL